MKTLDEKKVTGLALVEEENIELNCPFPSAIHPCVDAIQAQSLVWARSFRLCSDERTYRHLADSCISRLVARAFPNADSEGLQIAADWTTLFCLIDDKTEVAGTSMVRLAQLLSRLLDAFRDGNAGEDNFAMALVDLRTRMLDCADEAFVENFAEILEKLFSAFLWENLNRSNRLRPSLAAYLTMRETTVGLYPLFALAELTDGIKLSPETMAHPTVRSLMAITSNVVGWTNDLYTYEKELAQGEVHNLVMAIMHEENIRLVDAERRAVLRHDEEVRAFLELSERLPLVGKDQGELLRFVGMLRSWMRGHLDWAHETGRYGRGGQHSPARRAAHA